METPFNSSIHKKKSKLVPTEADEGSSVEFIRQTSAAEVGENFAPSQPIGGNHRTGIGSKIGKYASNDENPS